MNVPTKTGKWLPATTPAGAALISVLLLAFVGPIRASADTDTWWHLRTGELILDQGSLPRTDPFSWTAEGHDWVTHEWLTEVLYALVQRSSGAAGLLVLSGILVGISALALTRALGRITDDVWARAIAALVAVAGGSLLWSVRPHLFSLALLSVFLDLCLAELGSPGRRTTWLLVPLTLIWANLHGAFVIGPLLIFLFVLGGTLERDPGARRLGRILMFCLAAGCINPAGPSIYLYPLTVASVSGEVLEWRSPSIRDAHGLIFFLAVVATLAGAVVRRRAVPLRLLLPAGAFVLLGLLALRNIAMALVVLGPCLALVLGNLLPQAVPSTRDRRVLAGVVAALIAGAIVLPVMRLAGRSESYLLGEDRFPRLAVRELRSLPPGRLVNPYNWGGYLIYRAPEFPVSMDGRNDMYGARLLARHMLLEELRPGWDDFLDDHEVRYVLWQRAAPLAEALRLADGWALIHEDRRAVLFERTS